MGWLVLVIGVVLAVGALVLSRASAASPPSQPVPRPRHAPKPRPSRAHVEAEALRKFEAEVERLMPGIEAEIDAEAARLHAELMREVERDHGPRTFPVTEPPVTLGPNGGPRWMSAEVWKERLAIYRRQGRTAQQIRDVAEHLERRGPPPTLAERIDRAKSHGYVAREEYLSPEAEAEALATGPDGFPDAFIERVRDRLLVATPLGWVNPRSRTAASRAGLWSFVVRGTSYHESAARRGDFTPGTPVRLVREPDNPHDPSAIAIYAETARNLAGYVPRGYAKRLAKTLDAGADMVAVSTRGSGPGRDEVSPQVLVCERAFWEHLNRD